MLDEDTQYMQRALRLAARAAGRTSPNPMVGTVVVRGYSLMLGLYKRDRSEVFDATMRGRAFKPVRENSDHVCPP